MFDEDKIYEKWSKLLNFKSSDTKNQWLSEYTEKTLSSLDDGWYKNTSSVTPNPFSSIAFPIVKKISATTLGGGGGWIKSQKQQLKENRLNKIRKVQGEEPNIILPDDEYVNGLIFVKPLSAPSGKLFFMDYHHISIREIRRNKLNKIKNSIRVDKLKYINEILKNN